MLFFSSGGQSPLEDTRGLKMKFLSSMYPWQRLSKFANFACCEHSSLPNQSFLRKRWFYFARA